MVMIGIGPNQLVVNVGNCCVNEIVVPSPLVVGTWTHLALTFDYLAGQYTVYVQGHPVATATAVRDVPTRSLDVGGHRSDFGQNFFFHGLIDEVHVFDRVLTPAEIQELATVEVSFATFLATVDITVRPRLEDSLDLLAFFTLGPQSDGLSVASEPVMLHLQGKGEDLTLTIPPGAFVRERSGRLTFEGTINGVQVAVWLLPLGARRYVFHLEGTHANLTGMTSPVIVTLTIGDDRGSTVALVR